MAANCVADGNYLGEYSRFFAEFVARMNPDDQLPVKVSVYDVNENELVGEIVSVTLQYVNRIYCPPSLQSYISYLAIQAIKITCKAQPEICGLRQQQKTYAPLKLMHAITNTVNEICKRYSDNSRLALLPPPSSTPQVTVGAIRNARRKMEDRHMILHDLNTIFNIQDDTIVDYYAVFDGHGGQDAAAYCATHLHQYLVESVHYPTDPERALRDAFLTTDAQFIAKSSVQKLSGGTTAVCALLINKKLYIAWVGDSMASLVTNGHVKQLVNPHRPARKDEDERIRNLGGVVTHCMGALRVNGFLSISRAIALFHFLFFPGDVPYKPYVSSEPEVRCVPLNGTEDFLIIACDGLWDYVDQRTAALRVYRQVLQNPCDLKQVHQALLQSAKRGGSLDNITVIVVFLTPPIEIVRIASRSNPLLTYQPPNGLLLNNMDPNNPIPSNHDEFDVKPAYIKQLIDDGIDRPDFDLLLKNSVRGMNRNGKHRNDDDAEYDYTDIGPETDVDAGEDVHDNNYPALATSSNFLKADQKNTKKKKPLQHALIVADNVADSEDSEDEWDYYRADPNKQETAVTAVTADESLKDVEEQSAQETESVAEASLEVQSSGAEDDIKYDPTILDPKFELIDIDISEEKKEEFRVKSFPPIYPGILEGMDFQLNPEAAEFVPLSPPLVCNRSNTHLKDFAISGSPLKTTQIMDDICVPSQSEFDKEVCRRPKEIGEETHDENAELQNNSSQSLDISDISSTKAEIGDDESMMHVMSTSQWQTDVSSQWNEKAHDDAGSDLEDGVVTKDDPMTVSLTPASFKAFELKVDLNALHILDDSSDGAEQANTPPRSPEPSTKIAYDEDRPNTPSLEDTNSIDVLCASTPQPPDDSVSVNSETTNSETKINEKESLFDSNPFLHETVLSCTAKKVINNVPGIDIQGYESEENVPKEHRETFKEVYDIENSSDTEEDKNLCKKEDNKDAEDVQAFIMRSLDDSPKMLETENVESEVPTNLPDSTSHSDLDNAIHTAQHYLSEQKLSELVSSEHTVPDETLQTQLDYCAVNLENNVQKLENLIEPLINTENQSNQSTDWTDYCKTEKAMLHTENFNCEVYKDDSFFDSKKQEDIEKLCNEDKDSDKSDFKPDSTTELIPSDSIHKFNFMEEELQHENQMFEESVPITILTNESIKQEQIEEKAAEFVSANVDEEVLKEEITSENIPPKQEEIVELQKTVEVLEDIATIDKSKETEVAQVSVEAAVVATAAAVVIASSKAKTTTTTSAKRPTKTTVTKTTTKAATKSPTSPSKAISTTMRTTTTSLPASQLTLKKTATSTATRPKQLEGSTKTTVSSASGKTTTTKTTVLPKSTTATRTSASPRKPATTKPASTTVRTTTTSTTAKTLVKTSTATKTSTSNVTSKPRPMSATLATKSASTLKQPTTGVNGASRPKTAPTSGGTTKPRESKTITATGKSPLIDKQSKETVNKQISRSGASVPKTSARSSVPIGTATGIAKTRTSTGKSSGNASATSPTKKTLTSKSTSRTTSTTVTKRLSSEAKVLQNGITKEDAVITATNKPEDDVPLKDASPVNMPIDNQLIAD
ncbi:Protein phosphatase 1E [Trachymyrmex septentrionalis]|uniref:Protein phosphatase 1E n=1 Tax=Trachymyrmex septentrionalis TaxID=34720 RepID=A0A195FJB2_9HYME|nr:Protein phosphatase 1E [Trachymyrmex septentrionalis]